VAARTWVQSVTPAYVRLAVIEFPLPEAAVRALCVLGLDFCWDTFEDKFNLFLSPNQNQEPMRERRPHANAGFSLGATV